MKWTRDFSTDGSANWVEREAPMGCVSVGYNPHMTDDRTKPYSVTWRLGYYGDDVRIGYAATEEKGKAVANRFMRDVRKAFGEAK